MKATMLDDNTIRIYGKTELYHVDIKQNSLGNFICHDRDNELIVLTPAMIEYMYNKLQVKNT